MNTPLVSVGIPTFNRPEGLQRTLDCITKQSYKNLEIIVSDNCTSGENGEKVKQILEDFSRNDNRIKYHIQKENIGANKNFAFVLKQATGEYFMWAADDDEYDNKFIKKCVKNHLNGDYCVVFSRTDVSIKGKKSFLNKLILNPDYFYVSDDDWHVRIEKYLSIPFCTHKANILYGLWQREFVTHIYGKLHQFSEEYIYKGMNTNTNMNMNIGIDIATISYALIKKKALYLNETLFHKFYTGYIPGSYKCSLQYFNSHLKFNYIKKCVKNRRIYFMKDDTSLNLFFVLLSFALKDASLSDDEINNLLKLQKTHANICSLFE